MSDIDLLTSSYQFDLPKELVAQRPKEIRHKSRLLIYNAREDRVTHTHFDKIGYFLPADSLLVLNNSKVFKARLKGKKYLSGGQVEFLFLSPFERKEDGLYLVKIRSNRKKNIGDKFLLSPLEILATIEGHESNGVFKVSLSKLNAPLTEILEKYGETPIPPYIRKGNPDLKDSNDYQNIWAQELGSVAAPTAGFHFSNELLERNNWNKAYITLHIGLGTFLPVKSEKIVDHKMHYESFFITKENLKKIKGAQNRVAVGTTSLRVLESIVECNVVPNKLYQTDIFLHPSKKVRSINGLITNFHLPQSTLIMLVAALIGREKTLELYKEAISRKYRFFSYGDAMFIHNL